MLIDSYFFYATRNSHTISNDLVENKQVFSIALTARGRAQRCASDINPLGRINNHRHCLARASASGIRPRVRVIAFGQAGSVQPQLSDVPRIWAQFITVHALDDVRQHGIGAAGEADLLTLAHHEAVEEFDLRASALLHVLAHGGTLLGGGVLAVFEALLVAGAHRRLVALARAR